MFFLEHSVHRIQPKTHTYTRRRIHLRGRVDEVDDERRDTEKKHEYHLQQRHITPVTWLPDNYHCHHSWWRHSLTVCLWTIINILYYAEWQHKCVWLRGTVVERRSLTGELSLSCARPAADGWPLMWVNRPLYVSQPGRLSLSSFRGR